MVNLKFLGSAWIKFGIFEQNGTPENRMEFGYGDTGLMSVPVKIFHIQSCDQTKVTIVNCVKELTMSCMSFFDSPSWCCRSCQSQAGSNEEDRGEG